MSKCVTLTLSVLLLVLPLRGQTGSYPRIGSLWWGDSIYSTSPAHASQIQLYLAPYFTAADAAAVRLLTPTTPILTTINAESTVGGLPSVPDSYYLKTVTGQNIVNWPGNPPNYVLNITNPDVIQLLAQYAYQQMTQTGFVYDGVFFDNVLTTISQMTTDAYGNPIQIDADGDGIADNPSTLDAAWGAGVYNLIAQFHQLAPTAYVAGHMNQIPPDPRSLTNFNGDSFVFDAVNIREGQLAFGQLWDSYQAWFTQGKPPVVTTVQSSPPNQIAYGYGYTPLQAAAPSTVAFGQTFYPNMRFGLGLALMNDGFSVYDFGDTTSPVTWWYDEYNFNLGTPATPASPLVSTTFPNLVANGGFESTLAPWMFEVTPDGQVSASISLDTTSFESGASSAHVTVNSSATQNWNIDLEQDGLSLISGVEYEVQFWARADSPLPIQLATQGGPPDYLPYGLGATVNLDSTWRQYSVSFVSPVTASDARLEFWFGEYAGHYWLDDVEFSQAPTRLYRRDFSNGIVLLNGTASPQTISLENGFQRFTGTQAPLSQYIIDDSSSSFTTTGQWTVDSFDTGFRQAFGPYYHAWQGTCHELDTPSGTAQWNLGIPADGQYTIQVWLPAAPASSTWTTNAVYQVIAAGQVLATFSLDQTMAGGGDQWFTIANVNLIAASVPVLQVSNGGSGALIADAVYVYSSSARYNDGSTATQVSLAPMDSILLERETPNQAIIFGGPGNQNIGAQLTLAASASSGLPVAFASNTLSTCSVAGSTATMLATGACSITARQTGNATFTSAVPVTQSFNVLAAGAQSQTITFPALPNQTFGASPFAISGTASSGLPVSFTSNATTVCTVSGNTVTIVAAGICSITASQAGNANYSAATPVTQSFTVNQASQTISFPALSNQTVGAVPFAVGATASSGLPVSFTAGPATVCNVSGNTVSLVTAGTCSITASQAGNANYSAATPVTQSFTVAAGAQSQTIMFPALPNQTFGSPPFAISGTASSGLTVSFTSNATTVCTVSGNTVTIVAAGICSITASQAGNANYSAATPVTQSFTVNQASQTISFLALNNQILGVAPFAIGATASSGLPVSFTSSTTALCTVSGNTVTIAAFGICLITASQPGNVNFAAAVPVTQSFTILPATALQYYALAPCRVADTRASQPFTGAFGPPSLGAYMQRSFPILSSRCSIPATARAYSLNFTVVPNGALSFLSAWPSGDAYPSVSTLNSTDGSVIANAANIAAGTGGSITVVAGNVTDLIIDINGYFALPSASSLEFFPLRPCRIADTRTSQPFTGAFGPPSLAGYVTRDFPIATSPCLPISAQAYSLNMTVVPPGPMGFLSTWPVGQSYPSVSTLNSPDGEVIANAVIVPAGNKGDINVVVGNPTDLLIDINGVFAAPGTEGLQFYLVTPCRVADTRSSQPFTGPFGPPSMGAYMDRNFPIQSSQCGIPATAQAYALNLTAVPQGSLSFLSTWPAGQAYPGVSTLNSPDGNVIANAAIVPAGTGGAITVVAGNPTDLIIDIVGYFAP